MAKPKQWHVVQREDGWAVRCSRASRNSSRHSTQREAEQAARSTARRESGQVRTHGRDGRIRSKDSYGSDPLPPRDTE